MGNAQHGRADELQHDDKSTSLSPPQLSSAFNPPAIGASTSSAAPPSYEAAVHASSRQQQLAANVQFGAPPNPYATQYSPQYSPPPVNIASHGGGVVHGAFDSSARFDAQHPPTIPPPPPGFAPNAAQLAAQHGASVVMTQRKQNFWTGEQE